MARETAKTKDMNGTKIERPEKLRLQSINCDANSKDGNDEGVFCIKRILGVRRSRTKSDEREFLIQWTDCPIYAATWHHENLIDPNAIKEFELLSIKEKQRMYRSWRRSHT